MTERIKESARTLSEIIKEQGLAVVLCCVLIGFVMWTSYSQQQRENNHLEYQQLQTKEMMAVIASNTAAMQSMTTASGVNTAAVEALRMEIMKK